MNRLKAYTATAITAAPPLTDTPEGFTLDMLKLPPGFTTTIQHGITSGIRAYCEKDGDINCVALFFDSKGSGEGKAVVNPWPSAKGKLSRANALRGDWQENHPHPERVAGMFLIGPELDRRLFAYVETKHGSWVAYLQSTAQPDGSTTFTEARFHPSTPSDGFHHVLFPIHEPDCTRN